MSFAQDILDDIKIFFDAEEFAAPHTVDGQPKVAGIIASVKHGQFVGDIQDAAYLATTKFYVPSGALRKPPVQGKEMVIDGVKHLVLDITDVGGVLTITLNKPTSR